MTEWNRRMLYALARIRRGRMPLQTRREYVPVGSRVAVQATHGLPRHMSTPNLVRWSKPEGDTSANRTIREREYPQRGSGANAAAPAGECFQQSVRGRDAALEPTWARRKQAKHRFAPPSARNLRFRAGPEGYSRRLCD